MAKFDYSKPTATANRLIERFGVRAVIRKSGVSAGPGYEPVRTPPTFEGIFLVEIGTEKVQVENEVKQTRKFLMRTLEGVVPGDSEPIMITGAESFLTNPVDAHFNGEIIIGTVRPLQPGGSVVLYEVIAKI